MDWTMILLILAVAAVCIAAFVLYSRRSKAAPEHSEAPGDKDKYAQAAQEILRAVGGRDNVVNIGYCTTRLRFEVKNYAQVDEKAVKAAGATGVIRPGKNACQVIIGTSVQYVYDELNRLLQS